MKSLRKAFTLIELLVVIAIIAILAAILFPVFAQAKASAKKAVSISNMKQELLAITMYSADADDLLPPATSWNPQDSPGDAPFGFGSGWCTPWTFLVLPYVKSGGVFDDPQAPANPKYESSDLWNSLVRPSYGYSYVYLSGWDGKSQTTASGSSVGSPAETVLLSNKWTDPETSLGGQFLGFAFDYASFAPLLGYTVEVPNCYNAPLYCVNNWGIDGFGSINTAAGGRHTGANAVRGAGQMVIGWVDGHVASKAPGAMTLGTNWNSNSNPGDVVYTDGWESKYLWDLQ